MKFKVENKTGENLNNLMRQARYRFLGQDGNQQSYIRPLSGSPYPRFHLYLQCFEVSPQNIEMNLHLDQRKPRYQGATAHNADYDGELVEQEAARLKQIFEKNA